MDANELLNSLAELLDDLTAASPEDRLEDALGADSVELLARLAQVRSFERAGVLGDDGVVLDFDDASFQLRAVQAR